MYCDAFILIHHTIVSWDFEEILDILVLRKKMSDHTFILYHELSDRLIIYWDFKIYIWTTSSPFILVCKLKLGKVYMIGCTTTLNPPDNHIVALASLVMFCDLPTL